MFTNVAIDPPVERIAMGFRLLPEAHGQRGRTLGALMGLWRSALNIRQTALYGLPTLGDFRVLDQRFRKTMVRIQAQRKQPIFQNVFLYRPTLAVELSQCHRIGVWCRRHNRDEFGFRGRAG